MGTLTSDRPEADYSCTQQELYTIAENGWTSYGEHQLVFAGKRAIYTVQKGTDALTALGSAVALPDEAAREALHVVLRIELVALAGECRIMWEELDSIIRDSFPENQYEVRRNEAGHESYAAASNENWPATKALMKQGADFIVLHGAALSSSEGGMLASFPTDFGNVRSAFLAKNLEFVQAEELTRTLTDAKLAANNAVYKTLMKMFADGRKYFRFQPSIRYQFTFERVLGMISGTGGSVEPSSGMKFWGVVTDMNGLVLPGVTIRLGNAEGFIEVVTEANGGYSIPIDDIDAPLSATMTVSKLGFMPSTRPVTAVANVNQEQNFQLSPMIPMP